MWPPESVNISVTPAASIGASPRSPPWPFTWSLIGARCHSSGRPSSSRGGGTDDRSTPARRQSAAPAGSLALPAPSCRHLREEGQHRLGPRLRMLHLGTVAG